RRSPRTRSPTASGSRPRLPRRHSFRCTLVRGCRRRHRRPIRTSLPLPRGGAMGASPTHEREGRVEDSPLHTATTDSGVWLTGREPGELLGVRRVVVSREDAEPIVVAELPTRQEAMALAEHILELVDQAAAGDRWAELGDRLVRPEAIVSVDVEHAE